MVIDWATTQPSCSSMGRERYGVSVYFKTKLQLAPTLFSRKAIRNIFTRLELLPLFRVWRCDVVLEVDAAVRKDESGTRATLSMRAAATSMTAAVRVSKTVNNRSNINVSIQQQLRQSAAAATSMTVA